MAVFSRFLQGWLWWGITGLFLISVLGPKAETLLVSQRTAIEKRDLITDFKARLNAPLSADRSLPYRSYVLSVSSEQDIANTIQTRLLETVRQSQARLIDLRETPTSTTLGGLSALMFRLEVEGDLQAILETIDSLGASEFPILIDRLELRPIDRSERPDRMVRMSANLTIWTGDI